MEQAALERQQRAAERHARRDEKRLSIYGQFARAVGEHLETDFDHEPARIADLRRIHGELFDKLAAIP